MTSVQCQPYLPGRASIVPPQGFALVSRRQFLLLPETMRWRRTGRARPEDLRRSLPRSPLGLAGCRSTACWSGPRRQGRCGTTWPRQIFRCWNSCWALSANTPVTYGRAYGAAIWFSGWMPCGRPATHTRRCRCPSFRPTRWRRSCGTARSGVTAPATNSPRSSPARSPPPPAKILKNLTSLLMANLN